METLLSSRKLYGAFSFPFKWAHWLGLDNMGMVILWFMLPTFIAAFGFPALFTSRASNCAFFFFFSLSPCHIFPFLSSCILMVLFLPASFLGGRSKLRPSLNDKKKKRKKKFENMLLLHSSPEQSWSSLRQVLGHSPTSSVPWRASFLCCAARKAGTYLPSGMPRAKAGWVSHISVTTSRPIACSRSIPGCGEVWVRILALFVVWLCSGHISVQFIQLPCFVFLDVVVRT